MIGTMGMWIEDWNTVFNNFRNSLSTYDRICVLGNVEAEPNKLGGLTINFEKFLRLCEAYGRDIEIMTGAHKDDEHLYTFPTSTNKVNVVYWPTFWLSLTLVRLVNGQPYIQNSKNNFNIHNWNTGLDYSPLYTFISMNGVPKVHRCILQDLLVKHDILKHGKFSWRNIRNEGHWYNFQHWKEEQTFLDQSDPNNLYHQEVVPEVFKNCLIQIVPETHEDRFFLTEKTAIPLFFNKPFIVAGSKGYHKKLQQLGFQLYDEIFDYSFDDVDDINVRYEMIVETVKPLVSLSYNQKVDMYKRLFDKCVYNKKLALRYALDTESFPSIWKELATKQYEELIHVNPYHFNNILENHKNAFEFSKL